MERENLKEEGEGEKKLFEMFFPGKKEGVRERKGLRKGGKTVDCCRKRRGRGKLKGNLIDDFAKAGA